MKTINNGGCSSDKERLKHSLTHSITVFLGFSFFYILFFSPVLFSDKLLAHAADGIAYFLPAFYSPISLWTEFIFAGYPIAADPQNMTWYPPAFLLSLVPNAWNAFIVSAYVLASSFAYCYAYVLTSSPLASTVAGLVYGMSGFMIAYLPMAAMIHAAVWMPLIVAALEKLRHRWERGWAVVGVASIACCFLSGHPQISVYGIGIGFFYALFLGWSAPVGRWKYYRHATIIFVLGISLCSIQLLPTIELSRLSVRSEMPFDQFISGSFPRWQGLQFLFPYLFGNPWAKDPFFSTYWGEFDPITTSGYVGLLPLLLSAIGVIAYRNRPVTRFWFCTGLITLVLSFGEDLWLGRLLYHVPAYNLFRGQSRHIIEFSLASSVLTGMGITSVQQRWASKRLIHNIVKTGVVLILVSLLGMSAFYSYFQLKANLAGVIQLNLLPWSNPAIGVPLFIFILGAVALVAWRQRVHSRWLSSIVLIVLVLDLASYGFWFRDWYGPMGSILAPKLERIKESTTVNFYRTSLEKEHQRFLATPGIFGNWAPNELIYPNLTRLWSLPNAGGYSPLILSRVSEMMQMDFTGVLRHVPLNADEHQLDIMAVRYLLDPPPGMTVKEGVTWADSNLGLSLGTGICATAQNDSSIKLDFPKDFHEATTIGLVTTMGCSVEIPDNAEVVRARVVDTQGNVETHSLRAGRDTSEQAYDCLDVLPNLQHKRAQIFYSVPTTRPDGSTCQSHKYVSMIQLNQPREIGSIELIWTGLSAVMNVENISLLDNQQSSSRPINLIEVSSKWQKVEKLDSGIIYENQQVLPRAWLVPEAISLQPKDILRAIHTSKLPNGQTYEPKTMALVEDNSAETSSTGLDPKDSVKILKIEETQVEIKTIASAPAFLVLSDVFYPGWKASIDGNSTQIFQTNYIQRGVKVPSGEHIVRFEFQPLSFRLGVGMTMISLFGGGYWLLRYRSKADPTVRVK